MKVVEIIKAVRWCFDEEAVNASNLADASTYDFDNQHTDMGLMDNIIKAKIGDAVRWICLYAPAELLGGSDEKQTEGGVETHVDTGILVDKTVQSADVTTINEGGGRITLDGDFIKLARVRVTGWHRAVKKPLSEDSEEYLQLFDENGAKATYDRPQAAIIDKSVKELEVWPWIGVTTGHDTADTIYYTYVAETGGKEITTGSGTVQDPYVVVAYALPPRVKTAFIYYLAFLVLSAYEDSRASRMLEIAKMNIGHNG